MIEIYIKLSSIAIFLLIVLLLAAIIPFIVSALSKGGFSMHTNPVIMIARC